MSSATAIPSASYKKLSPAAWSELPSPEDMLKTLLREQQQLHTPVAQFSVRHAEEPLQARYYKSLIPLTLPGAGEQFSFEVDLDRCTGCKACVVACHGLNGLDDDETWRDMGLIVAPKETYQQTVTTACHHCADPACMNGCPVLAYDKDATTGIVKHLDDQCIGCSYCILKCPYDVPKYNRKRGIVRKCDMCQGRLAAGEAPACVQACPTEAIAIRIVKRGAVKSASRLVPGAVSSTYTQPTTRYVTSRPIPAGARPADAETLRIEDTHWPLVLMLILTQAAAGAFGAAWATGESVLNLVGAALLAAGMAAAGAHLGQPFKAWRAWMGWKKSWLSREILVFGAFMPAAAGSALGILSPAIPFLLGVVGVFTSIMVYVDTKRPAWSFPRTAVRFFGTSFILGFAAAGQFDSRFLYAAVVVASIKWIYCFWPLCFAKDDPVARLMMGPLKPLTITRFGLGLICIILAFWHPSAALGLAFFNEILERILFFKTGKAWRMPGV